MGSGWGEEHAHRELAGTQTAGAAQFLEHVEVCCDLKHRLGLGVKRRAGKTRKQARKRKKKWVNWWYGMALKELDEAWRMCRGARGASRHARKGEEGGWSVVR